MSALHRITTAIQDVLTRIGYDGTTPLNEWLRTTAGGNYAKLLGKGTKTDKGLKFGVYTSIVYMSPAKEAGVNMCPWATAGCAAACLGHSSGHLGFDAQRTARIKKTLRYHLFREEFLADLRAELTKFVVKATKQGKKPAIRLNGSTDILWEKTGIVQAFPELTFYDYTKAPKRNAPANYHLTYSISERASSWTTAMEYLDRGGNAAVVVRNATQAAYLVKHGYKGYPALDGDLTDIRFDDAAGHVVVLYAKGAGIHDTSGFVQDIRVDIEWLCVGHDSDVDDSRSVALTGAAKDEYIRKHWPNLAA
jgi:hypothetical protein